MRRFGVGIGLVALALAVGNALANQTGPLQGNNIPFGSQSPNSTTNQTLTIQNTDSGSTHTIDSLVLGGANAGQFNLTNDNCSGVTLDAQGGANDHCTVTVQFKPTSVGSYSAEVDVSYDSGGQGADISDLSGSADVTSVQVSPGSLNFGSHAVSSLPVSSTVTVTNNGTVSVTVASSSISSGASDFSQDNGCTNQVLAPNGHCQISVSFDSTTAGAKTGNLQIVDTAPSSPENVSLSGTATAPAVSASPVSFGNVLLNHSSSQTLTVNNTGTAPLVFGAGAVSLATGAGNYTLSADTCSGSSIPGGQSCTVNVTFSPTLSGSHPGSVSLTDNAPNSPQSVALSGAGLSQFVSITPSLQNYGSLTVGRTGTSHVFTLKNLDSNNLTIGASPLSITGTNPKSFSITGDSCANRSIAPNATCTFTVQYTPAAAGALSAQLREADGAPDSPHTVALTGTAVHPVNVTNLRGSVGCSTVTMVWTPAAGQGLVSSVIRRSKTHIPRTPRDGTLVHRTRPGVLLNGGLSAFHAYYYAIWSVYRFGAGHPLVYSAREWIEFRTGELCKPQNHAVISTTRPTLIWRPVANQFAYGLKIFQHGSLIFQWAKLTHRNSFLIPAHWTFRGTHSLQKGGNYTVFVYAYTHARPRGFAVGKPSVFSIK